MNDEILSVSVNYTNITCSGVDHHFSALSFSFTYPPPYTFILPSLPLYFPPLIFLSLLSFFYQSYILCSPHHPTLSITSCCFKVCANGEDGQFSHFSVYDTCEDNNNIIMAPASQHRLTYTHSLSTYSPLSPSHSFSVSQTSLANICITTNTNSNKCTRQLQMSPPQIGFH